MSSEPPETSASTPDSGGPRRSLGRLFSWSLLGRGASAVYAWSVLILLAKLGDTASAELRLGNYVYALALTSPLVPLLRMELRALVATDAERRVPLRTYASLRALTGLGLVVLATGLCWLFDDDPHTLAAVAALGGLRAVEGGLDLAHGLYERGNRHDLTARSEVIRSIAGFLALAGVLWTTGSLPLGLVAVSTAWLCVLLLVDLPTALRLSSEDEPLRTDAYRELPEHALWTETLRAAPLGLSAFLVVFTTTLPRYFIENEAGKAALGTFGAVAYLMAALTLVNASIISTLRPRFGRQLATGQRGKAMREMLVAIVVMVLPGAALVVVGMFWGDQLLAILYRDSFTGQASLMVWLAIAHVFGSAAGVPRALLTAADRLRVQPIILVGAVIVCAVASAILVPGQPLLGAAQALLAARVFMLVANLGVAWWVLRTPASQPRVDE